MNSLLTALLLLAGTVIVVVLPGGAAAVLVCAAASLVVVGALTRVQDERVFLLQVFAGALLSRMVIGSLIYGLRLQDFFGGDAYGYDHLGNLLLGSWTAPRSGLIQSSTTDYTATEPGYGMAYLVAVIYWVAGRNMLATQFFNAVLGAATAPVIFMCARHIFQNLRAARMAALFVAFYPSLVLWSSQGLKDGPIVFLLATSMLATLKLGERLSAKYFALLVLSLLSLLTLRFYVFYMVAAAAAGAFVIGMRKFSTWGLVRQLTLMAVAGLTLTYLGVLRTAGEQLDTYGNLEKVQQTREWQVRVAKSGFGKDVDVSTTSGALTAIPVGLVYLLLAPFPWQLASLRQSITLPEMVAWWGSLPLLALGLYFTLKWRLRQALPILIFTTMLTLAYSIFQGNVGTAYRQRSQLLVFYFIFVAVGYVLVRERAEERKRRAQEYKQSQVERVQAMRRYSRWNRKRGRELEDVARDISERVGF
jgi:hypothetical protein